MPRMYKISTFSRLLLYIVVLGSPLTVPASITQDSIIMLPAHAAEPENTLYYKERKFDEGFQDNYSGSDFEYEKTVPKSDWDRFKEWLIRFLNRLFSSSGDAPEANWLVILIRILAFAAIGLVVYFIVRAILNKESLWIFGRANKKIAAHDLAEENIHEMDFATLVTDTTRSGNYRLAVRYYYLWLLKKLSNRELIQWHWDKTNSDYLYEINDKGLKKDFEYLSYVYDHSWYGGFPVDEKAFQKAEKAFQKTLNTL